jgi:DNA-binding response OmpR family regulator/HPt (histidine-containing phosphotransfer) domain-containing protein
MKILVVEDDASTGEALVAALDPHYSVEWAIEGQSGLELATQIEFDLILLDVVIPKLDGIHLCQTLRRQQQTPIILLTAKDSHNDRLLGFDAGADDYVVKPFDVAELLARVKALVRRGSARSGQSSTLTWDAIELDPERNQVNCGERIVHLTPKEYDLLELFLRHPSQIFSRSTILDRLWTLADSPGEETVSTHIKCIRQKLKKLGSRDPIETVHGRGYRLRDSLAVHEGVTGGLGADRSAQLSAQSPAQLSAAQALAAQKSAHRSELEVPAAPIDRDQYHQQIAANIAQIWNRSKAKFWEQVTVLDQAALAFTRNDLSPELKQQAQHQAHRLAGSLGIFGLMEGSHLARQIEQLLQQGLVEVSPTTIADLVNQLKQVVASKNETVAPENSPNQDASEQRASKSPECRSDRPHLLVIDRSDRGEGIQRQASQWNLTVELVADAVHAPEVIARCLPTAILFNLSDYRSAPKTGLARLREVRDLAPDSPLLVVTDGGLADRLSVAQVGNCTVLDAALWDVGEGESAAVSPDLVVAILATIDRANQPKKPRLLIVDDDPVIIDQLIALLTPLGLDVTGITQTDRLWEILTAAPPQLLILDLEMPDVSGIDLCQVIRQDLRWRELPILFFSAHSDRDLLEQAFTVGADDYISKGLPTDELITRISRRLKRVGFNCLPNS